MVTRKRTQTQDPHHPVLSDGFCTIIVDEYSVVLLVFSTILMIYKNKKKCSFFASCFENFSSCNSSDVEVLSGWQHQGNAAAGPAL